jgi:hypothetical protein
MRGRVGSMPNLGDLGKMAALSAPADADTPRPAKPPSAATPATMVVSISGALMSTGSSTQQGDAELFTLYDMSVRVGGKEVGGARRRYREFCKLQQVLLDLYPHLLAEDGTGEPQQPTAGSSKKPSELPPFPRKYLLRSGNDPHVVVERVTMLGAWLSAVVDKLQFASLELVSFLNVPLYAAIRLLSGDLQVRPPRDDPRGWSHPRSLPFLFRRATRLLSPPPSPLPLPPQRPKTLFPSPPPLTASTALPTVAR